MDDKCQPPGASTTASPTTLDARRLEAENTRLRVELAHAQETLRQANVRSQTLTSAFEHAPFALLQLVNSYSDFDRLVRESAKLIQSISGCEAIGIRLRKGDDFPYYETRGFPSAFVKMENSLCGPAFGADGAACSPTLECMCGAVICGRTDPSLPFFTPHGSFWTNSTSRLPASSSQADRPSRTRNCHGQGYESVALIPLRSGGQTLGLLQLNDRRPDRFSLEQIESYERLTASLAAALSQREAARALELSEERWQFALEGAGDGVWDWNPQNNEVFTSRGIGKMLAFEDHELPATIDSWLTWIHPDDQAAVIAGMEQHLDGLTPYYSNEHRVRAKGGSWVWVLDRGKVVQRTPNGKPLRVIGTHKDITQRRRAEERLRILAELLDTCPTSIIVHDKQGNILYVNQKTVTLHGHTLEQFRGMGIHQLDAPHSQDLFGLRVQQLETDGEASFEVEHVSRDGTRIPLWVDTKLAKWGDREVVLSVASDLTERKLTEEALHRSEEQYRRIVETASEGIWSINEHGRTSYVNDRMASMLGFKPIEMLGQSVEAFLFPDDIADHHDRLKRRRWGRREHYERRLRRKDGSTCWCHISATPQDNRDGAYAGSIAMVTDISERKQATEMLLRLRTAVEQAADGIAVANLDGIIQFVNSSWASLHGMTAQEAVGRHLNSFLAPDQPAPLNDKGGQHEGEQWRVRRNGDTFQAWISCSVMKDAEQTPIGLVVLARDISEQKRLEAQYRQAQKMEAIGRLAAGIAHDFNNQLTIIQGYCELLLSNPGHGDPVRDPLTQIHQAAKRAQSTTSHLLSLSRKQILQPELIDLGQMLGEMVNPISRMIGENIRLTVAAAPGLGPVFVDRSGLHQAIVNLIINACDAMPNGGGLVLRTSSVQLNEDGASQFSEAVPGSYLLLEVIDSGTGMDPQTLERVFDPFFTTKEVGKGTGLGIPMVQGFIRQSHGYVGFGSQVGKGTTVRLLLPPATDKQARSAAPAPTKPPVDGKPEETILVVEDEDSVRSFVVKALQEHGYQVQQAARPSEAIRLCSQQRFDLLITDIVMPEMRGDEMARQLQADCRGLRVLYMSGYAGPSSIKAGSMLHKPFGVDELLRKVRRQLHARSVRT